MLGAFKQQCILSLVKRREGKGRKDGLRQIFFSACSTGLVSFGQTNEESRVFCKKRTVFLKMFLILVPSPSAKVMAPYSSGKSHGWRRLVGCSPWGHQESDTTERLHFHFSLSCIGEENGNPLQCSCLENPRDGGAWWAAISGVAQSRT